VTEHSARAVRQQRLGGTRVGLGPLSGLAWSPGNARFGRSCWCAHGLASGNRRPRKMRSGGSHGLSRHRHECRAPTVPDRLRWPTTSLGRGGARDDEITPARDFRRSALL
jgi:hypothetical protein